MIKEMDQSTDFSSSEISSKEVFYLTCFAGLRDLPSAVNHASEIILLNLL